jgi:hypothetical protein
VVDLQVAADRGSDGLEIAFVGTDDQVVPAHGSAEHHSHTGLGSRSPGR